MPRKGEQFSGLTVALLTPFTSDGAAVDEDALRTLVDWHVEQGTDCLAPCGTTGESPTLTHDEHDRVIALVCERAAGRLKVIAGTGSNSTAEAVRLTKAAQASGADGALLVAPYYNKPTQDGFFQHYAAIADACDLPQMVYNIPGRSAANIEPETMFRIAEIDSVVAVKEASGSIDQVSAVLGGCDLTVLSGDDSMTLPILSLGGSGIVSVAGNIVPADVRGLVTAWQSGDVAGAQAAHRRLYPLCRDMLSLATNPIPVKAAVEMIGKSAGPVRLPLVPLTDEQSGRLRTTLAQYGLL